jgi:hypothetical protein
MEGPGRISMARGFERTDTFANGTNTSVNSIRTNVFEHEPEQSTGIDQSVALPPISVGVALDTNPARAALDRNDSINSGNRDSLAPRSIELDNVEPIDHFVRWPEVTVESQFLRGTEEALDALMAAETECDRDILDQIFGRL